MKKLLLKILGKREERKYWNNGKNLFESFMERNNDFCGANDIAKSIAVWVCPWCGTAVPWYNIVIALLLKRYGCVNVDIIVNDVFMKGQKVLEKDIEQNKDICYLLKKYEKKFKDINIIYLSSIVKDAYSDEERLEKYAYDNMIIQLGNSFYDEQCKAEIVSNWKKIISEYTSRIPGLLRQNRWDTVIFQGGIYRESGVLFDEARKNEIDVVTMDCGEDIIQISRNGFAGACGDAKKIVDILLKNNVDEICQFAQEGHSKRRYNIKDEKSPISVQYQNTVESTKKEYSADVVVFTNLEHEISANGKHCVFKDDKDWICSTVDYILSHTSHSITVREHPMWRLFPETGLKRCLEKWENNARFSFVSCNDKVSSYELIENSKVVIVSASTIGLEAVMMGKPVVMETAAYYSDEEFVDKCDTKEKYFEKIEFYLNNRVEKSKENIDMASLFYYVTQYLLFVKSYFVPVSPNYDLWISKSISELVSEDGIKDFLESVVKGTPYAYLCKPTELNY